MAKGHGGKRRGAGRKPKADELLLIERLSPMDDVALEQLEMGVKAGDFKFIKLFMEYRFGRPVETMKLQGDSSEPIKITVNID